MGEITVGDVVELKSGGPQMTVIKILENDGEFDGKKGEAYCKYYEFDKGQSVERECFYPPVALRIIEDRPFS